MWSWILTVRSKSRLSVRLYLVMRVRARKLVIKKILKMSGNRNLIFKLYIGTYLSFWQINISDKLAIN